MAFSYIRKVKSERAHCAYRYQRCVFIVKRVVGASLNCIIDLRLTDDFATTLATGNEAVRMLLEASPSDITFMVFAARWDEAVRSAAAGSRNAFCQNGHIPAEK